MPAEAGVQDAAGLGSCLPGYVAIQKSTQFLPVMLAPDQVRDDGSGIQKCSTFSVLQDWKQTPDIIAKIYITVGCKRQFF